MALGGGVFVTQNKSLPGAYINVRTTGSTTSTWGDRGVVAIPLALGQAEGTVIEITRSDFIKNSKTLLGKEYSDVALAPLREIFLHANKAVIYDMGESATAADAVSALEPYEFNILCAYTDEAADVTAYISAVKNWRDEYGKKCQIVVHNQTTPNHEAVINVCSMVSDTGAPDYALVAWVAGAEAGCALNSSCTNMIYDGEYTVVSDKTQAQLVECLNNGMFVFHLVYGDIRVLEDINSLTEVTEKKGEDFKYNQTMRVVDQICNDIAKLFSVKYLGKIPNNASGRLSFWGDIVAHHNELVAMQALESFDSSQLTVEQGESKKSIVVNDAVKVTNALAQLYMTVVVS